MVGQDLYDKGRRKLQNEFKNLFLSSKEKMTDETEEVDVEMKEKSSLLDVVYVPQNGGPMLYGGSHLNDFYGVTVW